MRILFTGDFQAAVSNLDRCASVVDQIESLLKINAKNESQYFVFLGDAKEAFNSIDQRVTNFLVESFQRIQRHCEGFYFIRGNHDSITVFDGSPSCVPL